MKELLHYYVTLILFYHTGPPLYLSKWREWL